MRSRGTRAGCRASCRRRHDDVHRAGHATAPQRGDQGHGPHQRFDVHGDGLRAHGDGHRCRPVATDGHRDRRLPRATGHPRSDTQRRCRWPVRRRSGRHPGGRPRRPRSPAATAGPNPSGPSASTCSQVQTESASSTVSSPLWSTRPATSSTASSTQMPAVSSNVLGKTIDLGRALEVLQRGHAHGRLALGDDPPQAGHHAAQHDALLVELLGHVRGPGVDVAAHLRREVAQRVVRQVQPEQLLLPARPLPRRRLRGRAERSLQAATVTAQVVEQRALPRHPVALLRLAVGDGVVEAEQHLGRMTERGERADLDQRLQHPLVDEAQVDPGAQVGERPEVAARLACRDHGLDGALADVLDRQQPEPDGLPLDREVEPALVDVRWQDRDAQAAALRDRTRHLARCCPGTRSARWPCTRPGSSP